MVSMKFKNFTLKKNFKGIFNHEEMYVFNSIKKIEKKISKLEETYMEWKDDNNKRINRFDKLSNENVHTCDRIHRYSTYSRRSEVTSYNQLFH